MMLNIIHLEDRQDRLVLLKQEIEIQNVINYKYWAGIRNDKAPWTGISQSHKQIVRNAQNLQLPQIMIAEDDVKFSAPGAFNYFLLNMPQDFDLYLGGIMYGNLQTDHTVEDFSGTMLYIVHERFYNTFLSVREDKNFDRALAGQGKYIVCNPMIATQHNGFSDNVKREADYTAYTNQYTFFNK